tara:strand:+ start:93 stop:275 length:183 start_codon:yes stop_codon:yes gene_type:complete
MDEIKFTSAQYCKNERGDTVGIKVVVDGKTIGVPIHVGNRHYDEIQKQLAAGTLTVADAD